jgi:hypothetical protein
MAAVAGRVVVSGILPIGLPIADNRNSKTENRKPKTENRRGPCSRSWNRFSIAIAETQNYVVPAKAGIQQADGTFPDDWEVDSRFRGNDFGRMRHRKPSEPIFDIRFSGELRFSNFDFRLSQFDARIITCVVLPVDREWNPRSTLLDRAVAASLPRQPVAYGHMAA